MPTDPDAGGPASTRSLLRAALAVLAAAALVLSATLVPALSAGTIPIGSGFRLDRPPQPESLPTPPGDQRPPTGGPMEAGTLGGALNPGSSTNVGDNLSGALQSRSTTVVMTVESPRPAYWRTAAYDRYTGGGWKQSKKARRTSDYAGPLSVEGGGEPFQQVYHLELPAGTLPAAWRPRSVSPNVADRLRVSDQRGLRVEGSVPAGASYYVTSVPQTRDPAVLRSTERTYPAAVEQRYTRLPDDVPGRVAEKTDRITASADNPYDAATAIERWLESNKRYSLNASYRGTHLADHFIFEAEKGYCEFFATTMVVMLRTQGIPARYVVGYSTGQPVGEDTYEVRGMNAHAWVEVYFAGVGWVRFDPTPGSARLAEEQAAMENSSAGGGYDHVEEGSPGETFDASGEATPTDPGEETPTDTPDEGTPPGTEPPPDDLTRTVDGYTVRLLSEPVPGTPVTVEVTRNGEPVEGALVLFNGEPIGRTDSTGTVVGWVPYARRLVIDVEADAAVRTGPGSLVGPTDGWASVGGFSDDWMSVGESDDGWASVGGFSDGWASVGEFSASATPIAPPNNSSYELPTDIDVGVEGQPIPGETVVITASIRGVAVAGAAVRVDGRIVGYTNRTGQFALTVPRRGRVEVTVRRGAASGSTVLEPRTTVDVTVANAVPGRTAVGKATLAGEPVGDARVFVDGEPVGRTDAQGRFRFSVPYEARVNVTVRRGLLEGTEAVDLPTDATVEVVGDPVPGEEVTVVATLDGKPLPEATVIANGSRVGTTGPDGRLNVTVPYADPFAVTVRRGAVAGNASVDAPPMNLTVSSWPLPVAAAGLPVRVTVTVAGEPVPDATVAAGSSTATTDADGTGSVGLPLRDGATVRARRGELAAGRQLSGLLLPYEVLLALLVLAGAVLGVRRRYGLTLREMLLRVRVVAARLAHLGVALLVVAARRLDVALGLLASGLLRALSALVDLLARVVAALPTPGEFGPWLAARLDRLAARLRALVRLERPVEAAAEAVAAADDADLDEQRRAIRAAWRSMVDRLPVTRRRTKTPGELARTAVREGFPSEAVYDLTDAFREVEYGELAASRSRLRRTKAALDRIKRYAAGEEEGST